VPSLSSGKNLISRLESSDTRRRSLKVAPQLVERVGISCLRPLDYPGSVEAQRKMSRLPTRNLSRRTQKSMYRTERSSWHERPGRPRRYKHTKLARRRWADGFWLGARREGEYPMWSLTDEQQSTRPESALAVRVGAAPAPRRVAGSLNRVSAIRLASALRVIRWRSQSAAADYTSHGSGALGHEYLGNRGSRDCLLLTSPAIAFTGTFSFALFGSLLF
jgi:hypothetical protein